MGLIDRLDRLERRIGDVNRGDDGGRGDREVRARLRERWARLSPEEQIERLGRVRRGEVPFLSDHAVRHAREILGWEG